MADMTGQVYDDAINIPPELIAQYMKNLQTPVEYSSPEAEAIQKGYAVSDKIGGTGGKVVGGIAALLNAFNTSSGQKIMAGQSKSGFGAQGYLNNADSIRPQEIADKQNAQLKESTRLNSIGELIKDQNKNQFYSNQSLLQRDFEAEQQKKRLLQEAENFKKENLLRNAQLEEEKAQHRLENAGRVTAQIQAASKADLEKQSALAEQGRKMGLEGSNLAEFVKSGGNVEGIGKTWNPLAYVPLIGKAFETTKYYGGSAPVKGSAGGKNRGMTSKWANVEPI